MSPLFALNRFSDKRPKSYVDMQVEMLRCQVTCWLLRLQHGLIRGVVYERLASDTLRQWQLLSECEPKPFAN